MRSRLDHRGPLKSRNTAQKKSWDVRRAEPKKFFQKLAHLNKRVLIWSIAIVFVFLALVPPATYLYFAKDLKDKDSIMNRGMTGLTLQDRDGETFYTFYQPKDITYVNLDQIPDSTQKALIATEDKNFYTNQGFSITGIMRAFYVNLTAGGVVEGGSTITQGLAKNAFLSSSRNFLRKYQELVLAIELTRRFSKEDIMEMYLNSVYFGEGAFGIENASQAYFGKPAKELDIAQSALLIGLLPAPSAYSPLSNEDTKALVRQEYVLSQMVDEGYITQAEADAATAEVLAYNPNLESDTNNIAQHFAIYVRDQIIEKYGEERVIREGFTVTTSLDREFQEYSEEAVKNRIANLQWNNASNAAAVAIEPKSGEILAMVGSYDWNDPSYGQTNMALTPRQPGSSFKPLIYARAIEDEIITPATIIEDKKTVFNGGYEPKNYDRSYRGDVTVRRALSNSLNIPAVKVMEDVGVSKGLDTAEDMGITTLSRDVNYGLSLVLGTGEVPLLEMTNAYAVFANEGVYTPATGIIEIKNKYGSEVKEEKTFLERINPLSWFMRDNDNSREVMSKETAFLISSILSDNQARAETFGSALTTNRNAAVKTGTTEDYRDALTIGYTPSLVVGVWVGNNDNSPMDNVAGSLGAAPIWRNMLEHELMGLPIEEFLKPTFVVEEIVCPYPGRGGYKEYFIAGTQPDSCGGPTRDATATITPTKEPSPTPKDNNNDDSNDDSNQPTDTPTPTEEVAPTTSVTSTPTPTTASGGNVPTIQVLP